MKIELTIEQVNYILDVLSTRPYLEVHELIGELIEQGNEEFKGK